MQNQPLQSTQGASSGDVVNFGTAISQAGQALVELRDAQREMIEDVIQETASAFVNQHTQPKCPVPVGDHLVYYDEDNGQMYCELCSRSPAIPESIYSEGELDDDTRLVWKQYALGYYTDAPCIGNRDI